MREFIRKYGSNKTYFDKKGDNEQKAKMNIQIIKRVTEI